jgi:hypothetical protein
MVNVPHTGAVVSKIIVSVTSLVVFVKLSLNLIYTVFVPSPLGSVNPIDALHVVQLVGFAPVPYATCTPPTPEPSVAHVVFKVTLVLFVPVALLFIVNVPHTGAVVSKIIVSVTSLVVFVKLSRNLIYTVFVPSPFGSVNPMDALHVVQLVGFAPVPYATCTPPTPESLAHVVFKVTLVLFVPVALLFIVNVPPVGAV